MQCVSFLRTICCARRYRYGTLPWYGFTMTNMAAVIKFLSLNPSIKNLISPHTQYFKKSTKMDKSKSFKTNQKFVKHNWTKVTTPPPSLNALCDKMYTFFLLCFIPNLKYWMLILFRGHIYTRFVCWSHWKSSFPSKEWVQGDSCIWTIVFIILSFKYWMLILFRGNIYTRFFILLTLEIFFPKERMSPRW